MKWKHNCNSCHTALPPFSFLTLSILPLYFTEPAEPPNVLACVVRTRMPHFPVKVFRMGGVEWKREGSAGWGCRLGDPHRNLWLTCRGGDSVRDLPPEDRPVLSSRTVQCVQKSSLHPWYKHQRKKERAVYFAEVSFKMWRTWPGQGKHGVSFI